MMMPANFSAIAETEMTYVVGGGLEAYLAPVMTAANWQTYNTNLITIIGNQYMNTFIGNTLANIFGGEYKIGDVSKALWGGVAGAYETGAESGYTVTGDNDQLVAGVNNVLAGANGVLNGALNVVRNLAVVYTLGNGSVKGAHTGTYGYGMDW